VNIWKGSGKRPIQSETSGRTDRAGDGDRDRDRPRVRGKDSATCNCQAKTSRPDTDTPVQLQLEIQIQMHSLNCRLCVCVTVSASGTLVTTWENSCSCHKFCAVFMVFLPRNPSFCLLSPILIESGFSRLATVQLLDFPTFQLLDLSRSPSPVC